MSEDGRRLKNPRWSLTNPPQALHSADSGPTRERTSRTDLSAHARPKGDGASIRSASWALPIMQRGVSQSHSLVGSSSKS
ncbi:hypothetical protein E4U43_004102 [Claviceps pusilla]|uniref:Uncharacterized protein n=1 Tax=Claviceps pusilla TaxID=123648 RepID=A0A9P7NHL6_9HYPO|nr:hypothetical protein E4U43_004102 [Claviceps pusilla]